MVMAEPVAWKSLRPVAPALRPSADGFAFILHTSSFCLALSAFWLLTSAFCLRAASWRYQLMEVKPQVFVWAPEDIHDQESDPDYDRAGTAGFVLTDDGVVVINTSNSPFHAREILYEIRARTDRPVKFVINTDARPDHFLGNEVFADLGATLASTAEVQAQIHQYQAELSGRLEGDSNLASAMRAFHPTLPTKTFQGEWTLTVGGREFRLTSVNLLAEAGAGPSPGTAIVYLRGAKVLFLGDLYENGMIPRLGSSDLKGWIEFLKKVEGWDVDVYVPGHGPPADKREFSEFRRFLEFLSSRPDARPPEPAPHPRWRG
jgi:glyoxylase-like metal-dependent hydrolase (beta-lactamase superfamily II)